MDYKKEYDRWLNSPHIQDEDKEELKNLSPEEIEDRFNSELDFGTAGIRRKMEVGPGALNVYTVRHITRALGEYLTNELTKGAPASMVIAYDSRNNSKLYAEEASMILAAKGIHIFLYEDIRPTPELSFAVRYSQSISGINITASHNTKEYNGYKVYADDGAQISPEVANKVAEIIRATDILDEPEKVEFNKAVEEGKIEIINGYFDSIYLNQVLAQSRMTDEVRKVAEDMKVVYTAFHGTGFEFVPRILERDGFKNVICQPDQLIPDGDFPTVVSPNPETKESFKLAIELAEKEGADLIIGTDPDGDRCGVAIRVGEGYEVLTGNQIGVLLLDYLIKARLSGGGSPKHPYAVKSIVSTNMANRICETHGIEMIETLTGFKYIGEKMEELSVGQGREFIFGFEESNGYLTGLYARDKDAILASMLVSEMAAYHLYNGRTLKEALDSLYEEYGYFEEKVVSISFDGSDGDEKMARLMNNLRTNPPKEIGGLNVITSIDYLGDTDLPKSDVLRYMLEDGASVIIRPSGTEPKIKVYLSVAADSETEALEKFERLERDATSYI